ncbi:ZBED1 [Branchiostoma lanceolatum]|uniref:ZBED1 protein n=1 Tax=Branchiostoma lanceolatum TaxID=7740 RepID=A0A8J9YYS9_BRALA|nr:ZBED1 [Branchiostoma lanceolatum]
MTTDNARAMINASNMAGAGISLGCFAHTLNLAAQKLLEVKALSTLLSTIRPVITYFRKSYLAKLILKGKQVALGIPTNALILDCKTRWNSTYLMIERFIQQYPAIIAATVDDRIRKKDQFKKLQRVDDDDFNKMETFVQVAGLLYKMTTAMSTERRPTAGMVLPMMGKLRAHFEPTQDDSPFAKSLKTAVQNDLKKRYQNNTEQDFLEEATALDARFKTFCKGEDVWERIADKITSITSIKKEPELLELHSESEMVDQVEVKKEPTEKEGAVHARKTALEEIFLDEDELVITHITPPVPIRVRVQNEILKYRETPKMKSSEDTVLFWENNSKDLPLLAAFARQYLTAQASSVASERIFSTAGDIVKAERACIDPDHVNHLIFLKKT